MNRKIGKFKLWQLLAIGGALGLVIYEYEKSKKTHEGETPEGFVASNANPLAGGGGGGNEGALNGNQSPVAIPGEPGAPGPPGTPGEPGPVQATLSEGQREEVEAKLAALNQPLAGAALKPAPPNRAFPQTNPVTGKKFRTVKENGKTVHVYADGHKVTIRKKKAPARHRNPNHKHSAAAPRAAVHHGRPAKPKPHTTKKKAHR